ncbi:hypothetical protein [Legionella micdadei]|uniref:Uncharacterized protein n=1 Tax=Legionella micdadei TaxID=451 RepID=A0A098GEK2_LEGMI|nr:hypothetical protein [Legionella micdadei]NSL17598.1 hypothetical protein [Legionella micdadei]CEG60899.1 protein of unknown function [Legionella micdadei]
MISFQAYTGKHNGCGLLGLSSKPANQGVEAGCVGLIVKTVEWRFVDANL